MIENIDRVLIDLSLEGISKLKKPFQLVDGDIISFFKISNIIGNAITISRAVKRPGKYSFNPKMRVSDLLKKADGILGTTYLQRVEITRINDDKTNSLLDINIEKAMAGDIDHDVLLTRR